LVKARSIHFNIIASKFRFVYSKRRRLFPVWSL